jgi:hypothetical protein
LFILIDTDLKGLVPFYDYINEIDDKPVLSLTDLDDLSDYTPGGTFHVVDLLSESNELSRWDELVYASKGVRIWSANFGYWDDSPVWAGEVPEAEKIRKVFVDATTAETRAVHFASFGVNYIGRTKLSPRNIFVLDNKKGNPLHDPSKDGTLESLYASLPNDWWGSCGFVSSGNPDKLGAFLDDFQGDVIPLAFTTGAFAKLKYLGLEYVEMGVPDGTPEYGVRVREASNRLSYKLSEPVPVEGPTDTGWLQL